MRDYFIRRWHPARLLYLGLIALAGNVLYSEIQIILTSGIPAALDLDELQNTSLGHLATNYPLAFWLVIVTLLGVAGIGWHLDHQLSQHNSEQAHTELLPLPRARDLKRQSFVKLGDNSAANFPYLISPIQPEYQAATEAILAASHRQGTKRGILVVGEANAGKTRLAFETMVNTLPDWHVLRWRESYSPEWLGISALPKHGLVLFLDDLQYYVSSSNVSGGAAHSELLPGTPAQRLQTLVENLMQRKDFVVIATCRAEDEKVAFISLRWLFDLLRIITIPQFSIDAQNANAVEIITRFKSAGATHTDEWDGTLGSLVLGLVTKRIEYDKLGESGLPGRDAKHILQAMKLMFEAGITVHAERRVRAVCADIFERRSLQSSERKWQAALGELVRRQFVSMVETARGQAITLEIRKDSYFEMVITDYPSLKYQLEQDLIRLAGVFETLNDAEALVILADRYNQRRLFVEALRASEQARTIAQRNGDHSVLAYALSLLATIEAKENPHFGDYTLLEEAAQLVASIPGEAMLEVLWRRATLALRTQDWPTFEMVMAKLEPQEHRDKWREINMPQYQGEALGGQGRWAEAQPFLQRARANAQRLGIRVAYCAATGWLGLAHWHTGNDSLGSSFILESLRIEHDELQSQEGVAKWLRLLARLYCDEARYELALQMLLAVRLLDRTHILSKETDDLLSHVRRELGEKEYLQMEASFQPENNAFTKFAIF